MKYFLIFLCFSLFGYISYSQNAVAKPDQIATFLKTTTCVVLDDDIFNSYNSKIKEAVEKNWKITAFEFISMKQFNERRLNSKYSFLIRTKVIFDKDKELTPYSFLSLELGGSYPNLTKMTALCDFPLSYYNVDYDKYDYKLGAIVNFVQNHVNLTKANPDLNDKNIIRYYNKNKAIIKGKILYVIKDELDNEVNTPEKIKKTYQGEVKLVGPEEIKKLISDKDANAVFLHKVGPPKEDSNRERCFKLILGADDAKLYYFDYHKIKKGKKEDAFLKEDFINLTNQ